MRVVLKYASMECGELFVMTSGMSLMHRLPVPNLGTRQMVSSKKNAITHKSRYTFTCPLACLMAGAVAFGTAAFGQGTGTIYLDDVGCVGNETDILNCTHAGIGVNNCGHYEDAGVRCQSKCGSPHIVHVNFH